MSRTYREYGVKFCRKKIKDKNIFFDNGEEDNEFSHYNRISRKCVKVDKRNQRVILTDGVIGHEWFDKDVSRDMVYGDKTHETKKMISRIKRRRLKKELYDYE